jgi:hypothetical protein
METSPLPVKGCKSLAYARRPGPLNRDGSLSCHTCCDTGPRFFRSHPKDRPIQSPLTTHKGMWRIYSNPVPHDSPFQSPFTTCKEILRTYSYPDTHRFDQLESGYDISLIPRGLSPPASAKYQAP